MIPLAYDVRIDFRTDWLRILQRNIQNMGYKVDESVSEDNISFQYFNLIHRLTSPLPREVLFSREFTCPPNMQAGLDLIIERIKKGVPLRPHLSKMITNLDYDDDLLNDWGIYHFHLGKMTDNDGFVKRSGPLLFARFDESYAYLINIMPHGSWTKRDLIRIIHENWPETIRIYRANVNGLEPKITETAHKKLRDVHINTFIELDEGIVYSPIGGGYSSSGISTEVVRTSFLYFNRLELLEKYVRENISNFIRDLRKMNRIPSNTNILWFSLKIEENMVYAHEVFTQVSFKIGPLF